MGSEVSHSSDDQGQSSTQTSFEVIACFVHSLAIGEIRWKVSLRRECSILLSHEEGKKTIGDVESTERQQRGNEEKTKEAKEWELLGS